MMTIAVLILAAGSSSRMGRPKQLLKINNCYLLQHVITNATSSNATTTFCVIGANAHIIRKKIGLPNVTYLYNETYKSGISSSIRRGITHIEKNIKNLHGTLILLGDQPEVNKTYINSIIQLFSENPTSIIASKYGNKIGVPALFPKHYFKALLNLKGDRGAYDILNKDDNVILCNTPINLVDIDTEKDFTFYKNSVQK